MKRETRIHSARLAASALMALTASAVFVQPHDCVAYPSVQSGVFFNNTANTISLGIDGHGGMTHSLYFLATLGPGATWQGGPIGGEYSGTAWAVSVPPDPYERFYYEWIGWFEDAHPYWVLYDAYGACFFPEASQDYTYGYGQTSHASGTGPRVKVEYTREPISTISGNVYDSATDLAVPCPGIPLAFRRVYNSMLDHEGALGFRWTHNYEWSLSAETNLCEYGATNTYRVLRTGDGGVFWFRKNGGLFDSPYDNNWRLSGLPDGSCEVTLPGGLVYAFDTNGLLTAISNLWANTLSLSYTNLASTNRLSRVTHGNGQHLDLAYTNGLLWKVESPSTNIALLFSFNEQRELTNATKSTPRGGYADNYSYDADASFWNHSLTQHVNAAGDAFFYGYATNSEGHHSSTGISMVLGTNYYQHTLNHSVRGTTTVSYVRGNTSQVYRYYVSAYLHRVSRIRGPDGLDPQQIHSYDASGDLVTEKHTSAASGDTLWYERRYDACHNVTNEAFGYGGATPNNFWVYSWDTNLQVMTSITDPEGHRTGFRYTNAFLSRLELYWDASHSYDTVFGYTTNGLVSVVTNANGHWIQYGYDGYGRLSLVTPQAGPTIRYTNDVLGFVTKIIMPGDGGDRVTTLDRNELGWVETITYLDDTNASLHEHFSYDEMGNVTNHIDTGDKRTTYTWLPTRKLSSVSRQYGTSNLTTSLAYDNQFNTLAITDAKGRAVETYQLDIQDRPIIITNLEGQAMTITYGLGDYVKAVSRFDGTPVANTFNSAGQLSGVAYPDSTLHFTYLKNDLPVTAFNEICTVSNAYSMANRLTNETTMGLLPAPLDVSYGYDAVGNVSNTASVAGTQTLGYDEAERVTDLSVTRGGLSPVSFSVAYNDTNGLVSGVRCTNTGIRVDYDWDDLNRLVGITWQDAASNVLRSFTYTFDAAGMVATCALESGEDIAYTYDDVYRLTRETRTNSVGETLLDEELTYDDVGNRTAKTRSGITVNYTHSNGCNRLAGWAATPTNGTRQLDVYGSANEAIEASSRWGQLWVSNSTTMVTPSVAGSNFWVDGMSVSWGTQQVVAAIRDAAGNTTVVTNQVFVSVVTNGAYLYNSAGCVTNIQYSGSGYSENIGLSWNSQYRLTEVKTNGTAVERNGFDALGRRVWTWDGTTTNYMVYDGVHVLAEVDSTGGLRRAYTHGPGIDNWLAMTVYTGATAKTYFYLTDHQGTVHAVADETGSIVESYRFDAWGRVLGVYDGQGTPLTQSAIGNRFLWQGREYSWATRLYYFRARWYDPITGRWLSNDPIGISGGLNQYVFCANNPVNYIDPSGLCGSDSSSTLGRFGLGTGGAVAIAGLVENAQNGSTGYWVGKNGQILSTSWGGNGATGGRLAFAGKMAAQAKIAGGVIGTVGVGISAAQGYQAFRAGDTGGMIQSGADVTMGGVGFLGPIGWAGSTGYFVGQMIDRWTGASDFYGGLLAR